jgi:hypothetical protein
MNTDHRRPLVAFVLVAMAGALVLLQGMPHAGSVPLAGAPSFRALFDLDPAHSEGSQWFPLQDGMQVEAADRVVSDALAPSLGVVDEILGGGLSDGDDGSDDASGSGSVATAAAPVPASAGDQGQATTPAADTESALVDEPRAGQADGGGAGFGAPGGSPGYGGGAGGDSDDAGGDFASPPADGGPAPSGPSADQPTPHSFKDVPDHAHPYGHGVEAKPGSGAGQAGPKSDHAKGGKDKGGKDKGGKDQGGKDQGPKSKDKGPKGKGDQGGQGGKDKGPKSQGGKGGGKAKAKAPGWVKGGPR